jgi:hypothetical protein
MNKLAPSLELAPNPAERLENTLEPAKQSKNIVELDNELFLPMASQMGEENETIRNLLIDAEHKMGELDAIKNSFGKLVDPVSKSLRALEEAKSEKIGLQGALNNIRITNNKLRSDLDLTEKKVAVLDSECSRLRETLTIAQQKMSSVETTRVEQTNEPATRRTVMTSNLAGIKYGITDHAVNTAASASVTLGDKRAVQRSNRVLRKILSPTRSRPPQVVAGRPIPSSARSLSACSTPTRRSLLPEPRRRRKWR